MDRLLYVAMNGANQVMLRQTTNNHNLANLNTVGFRADFDTFLSKDFGHNGLVTRVYAVSKGGAVSNQPGDVFTTGRELDIAIDNGGYIAVQDDDGSEAYSRGGELTIGEGGMLQTKSGYPVLGDGGPISIPPHQLIQVGKDGTISILPPGEASGTMVQLERIKLVSIDHQSLTKGVNGLLKKTDTPVFSDVLNPAPEDVDAKNENVRPDRPDAAKGPDGKNKENARPLPVPADENVTVTAGALEASNVSPIDALVNMITLARQYEIHMKLMKSAEDNEATATQLLKVA